MVIDIKFKNLPIKMATFNVFGKKVCPNIIFKIEEVFSMKKRKVKFIERTDNEKNEYIEEHPNFIISLNHNNFDLARSLGIFDLEYFNKDISNIDADEKIIYAKLGRKLDELLYDSFASSHVASQGYALDKLFDSIDNSVLLSVVSQGYRIPDILKNEKYYDSLIIRQAVSTGYKLEKFYKKFIPLNHYLINEGLAEAIVNDVLFYDDFEKRISILKESIGNVHSFKI